MIFVDTNVLIDMTLNIDRFARWSEAALGAARAQGAVVTNAVVLAELAPRFDSLHQGLALLELYRVSILPMTNEGAYMAGRAHAVYRRAGGERGAVLADFLIGGHAASIGATLLTRDRQRFATYFPDLTLITPETDA